MYRDAIFVRILAVHSDQNSSYEITMNGHQGRKINEIRNEVFYFQLWETFLSIMAEVGMLIILRS